MTNVTPTSTKPDFYSVDELLDGVVAGEIRVPRFQRPYVWSTDDMEQLFDSILKGYPIGSLLIWQTERKDITSLNKIGPIEVPNSGPSAKSYVVDGHQRLATLLGVLRIPENYPQSRPDDWRWWMAYDLRKEQFIHIKEALSILPLHILPLRDVLRTVGFARRTREIMGSDKYDVKEVEDLIDRADFLQRAIRNYRIPYTLMKSGSLDEAVTIFSRVNQRGRDMTADQMVSALTFRDKSEGDFDLSSSIDEIIGEIRALGFGDLERRIILQIILSLADMDFTKISYEKIVDRQSHGTLRPAVERAKLALLKSVGFLRDEIGLKTSRLLPYASIMVMMGIYFDSIMRQGIEIDNEQSYRLQRWFWAVSFNGWFAGANTTDMRQAAVEIRKFSLGNNLFETGKDLEKFFITKPLRPFPETFDRRSARVRASLLVQIIAGKPMDPGSGDFLDGAEIFTNESSRDIPYFFPKQRRPLVSSLANRVILPGYYPRNVRLVFAWLGDFATNRKILESHFINQEGFDCLINDRPKRFLAIREKEILRAENEFLGQFGLSFDENAERGNEEFDSDE